MSPVEDAALSEYRRREQSITLAPVGEQLGDAEARRPASNCSRSTSAPTTPRRTACCACSSTLQGEVVRDIKPIIGYVHTGIEKTAEDKTYWKVIPVIERMDYLVLLLQLDGLRRRGRDAARGRRTRARAVPARDPPASSTASCPTWCGWARARSTSARSRCSGTASASARRSSTCSRCPRGSAHAHALLPGRRRDRGRPPRLRAQAAGVRRRNARARGPVRRPAQQQRDHARSACAAPARSTPRRCSRSA